MPDAEAPIPPEVQRKIDRLEKHIQQADRLEQERNIDAALAAYKACFDFVLRERWRNAEPR
jgi:hypothetical protein